VTVSADALPVTVSAVVPRPRRTRPASEFAELAVAVRATGLLDRRLPAYAGLTGGLVGVGATAAVASVVIGDSWWQLVVAVVAGIVLSQFGFLAHDAAHRQVFTLPKANEWSSRLVSTLVVGLSYGWWTHKHNKHHRSPNQVDRDPDIHAGGLVFTERDAARRPTWSGPITRHQGYLFFPLLLLEGLSLHIAGLRTLANRRDIPHRRLEAGLIGARFLLYATALLLVMSPVKAAVFAAVQVAVFGFFLGAAFAPNHKGMPILGREATLDFLRRQVLMSRNIRGGRLVDLAMGGLNYQIEHHLFPNMPRSNLRHAQPLVRAFCHDRGIAYTETSLLASYARVISYLNEVGLSARDPFACPFVDSYRR